jgi:hypothetical protein
MRNTAALIALALTTSASAQPLPYWEYQRTGKTLEISVKQDLTGIDTLDFVGSIGGVEWHLPGLTRANKWHTIKVLPDTAAAYGFDWEAADAAVHAGLTGDGVPVTANWMVGNVPLSKSGTWGPMSGLQNTWLWGVNMWIIRFDDSGFRASFSASALIPEPTSGGLLLIGLVGALSHTRVRPARLH